MKLNESNEFSKEVVERSQEVWLNRVANGSVIEDKFILNTNWTEPTKAEVEAYENMFKNFNVGPQPVIKQ